uniref:Cytochrome P450 n=1 Tax=Stomoxys calcitrans TaxID=35570 RepID=A0A1I8Q5D4_STOCA
MIKPQLDVLIIVEGSQNEKLEVANITNMDFCSFLEGKGAFKIMELWRNELMRSSNVPKKCPLKKGTVLNVNKFNINPDNFPPYVPEAGLRLQAILKERSVVLLTLNIHGVVKYKKSSRMRGGSLGGIIRMKTNFGFHLKKVYLDPKFENAPVVGVYILHRPALLIRDPEMLKSIFIKKFDNFRNHFAQPDPHFDLVGSKAMIFSRGSKIRQMYPLLQEVGANLERRLRQKGKRFVAEMRELSALYSIDTNNSTIFGVSSNALDNPKDEFANDIRKIAVGDWRQSIRYAFIYFLPQLVGAFKLKLIAQETEDFLRTTMTKLICERERTCLQRNDIIDAFVEMKKEATAEGENMSTFMNTLTGLTWSFMFAGFDTSASTMSSALLELAKHPDVQNKLRTEIEHAICQNNDKLSYEALNNLKYLDMVVREALRMYPALAITEREHSADNKGNLFSLKPYFDYNLPDGMAVMISISGMHYDPKHWPNPNVFDPDRFSMKNRQS